MRLFLTTFLLLVLTGNGFSQAQESNLVPFNDKGKWGYSDRNAKIKVRPEYDRVTFFYGNYATVEIDGQAGLINKNGTIVIPLEYDNCELFNDQYVIVELNKKKGLLDLEGKIILEIKYRSINELESTGLVKVSNDDKFGVIKIIGRSKLSIADIESDDIRINYNKGNLVCEKSDRYDILSWEGELINSLKKDNSNLTGDEMNTLAKVPLPSAPEPFFWFKKETLDSFKFTHNDSLLGLRAHVENYRGNYDSIMIPALFDEISTTIFLKKYLFARNDQNWKLLDFEGNVILHTNYPILDTKNSLLHQISNTCILGKMIVKHDPDGKFGLLISSNDNCYDDVNPTVEAQFDYDEIYFTKYYRYIVLRKGDKYGVLDYKTHNVILPVKYRKINDIVRGDRFKIFESVNKYGDIVFIGENGRKFYRD